LKWQQEKRRRTPVGSFNGHLQTCRPMNSAKPRFVPRWSGHLSRLVLAPAGAEPGYAAVSGS
jgi:hypothetical protein